MQIYLDVAFAVNTLVDYLLLRTTVRLAGCPWDRWRLVLAAALGGLFAAGTFLLPGFRLPMVRLTALGALVCLAFGLHRRTLGLGALFLLVSLALAGLVLLVAAVLDWGLILLQGAAYYPVSGPALVLTAGLGSLAVDLALGRTLAHRGGDLVPVTVTLGDRTRTLTALRDTGNTLLDPLTGSPVLIVEAAALGDLLPEVTAAVLADPVAAFPTLATPRGWRLLPYRAVGVRGCLLALPATVRVGTGPERRQTVALSPTPVSDGGSYTALIGGSV